MSLLQISQLSKIKGNTTVIPEINLTLEHGQCVVIQCHHELSMHVIDALIGKEPISSGEILFQSQPLNTGFKLHSQHIAISLLSDGIYDNLKVLDYLKFIKAIYSSSLSISDSLELLNLTDKKHTYIEKLNHSERKRLHLARCIVQDALLIMLEEPEQNVDIESQILIRKAITYLCDNGKALLITSSYLSNALSLTNDVYTLTSQQFKKVELGDEPTSSPPLSNDTLKTLKEKNEEPIEDSVVETIVEQVEQAIEETAAEIGQPTKTDDQKVVPVQQESSAIESIPLRVEKIPAKVEDKIILFDPTEIDYIESSDGICLLQVKGENFPCAYTMNDLEIKLRAFGFFRCHRSYIVNLQKVREVITWTRNSFSLILDDKKKSSIPLSKSKYDELKRIMGI